MNLLAINFNVPKIPNKKKATEQVQKNLSLGNMKSLPHMSMPYFKGSFSEELIDTRNNAKNISMQPDKKYIVNDEAIFALGQDNSCFLFLKDPIIRKRIDNLEENEKLIFGREGILLPEMDDYVSRKHLEISKNKNGEIIAKDLNSTNRTTVLSSDTNELHLFYSAWPIPCQIPTEKEIAIPRNCQIILGFDSVIDLQNPKIQKMLRDKKVIEIGRNQNNDIIIDDFHDRTSRKHLRLSEKYGDIYAQDLESTNGSIMVPRKYVQPFYFGADKLEFAQANIGDCYLLASVYALSRNPQGAKILENMIKTDQQGNYIVTFNDGEVEIVKPDELDGQTYENKEKYSVSSSLAVKALERAYAKKIREDEYSGKTLHMNIDDGGHTWEAIEELSGFKSKKYHSLTYNLADILKKVSEEENQENIILTCSTPSITKHGNYADKDHIFPKQHAYAILNNDAINKKVTIVNPHNTKEPITITWEDFAKIFSRICVTKVE